MSPLTWMEFSRNHWKRKAVKRGLKVRELRRQLRRMEERSGIGHGSSSSRAATSCPASDGEEPDGALQKLAPVIRLDEAKELRAFCVQLVIGAVLSFRSVPRVLNLMASRSLAPVPWIPRFTSVINWTHRLGLARLNAVREVADPWIAIIDCSIDVSVKKALVVLRVSLNALEKRQGAVTLEDCECIGLEVAESWHGESVSAALSKVFLQAGKPTAILKDGGGDLNKGVNLWRKNTGSLRVPVIQDIGHIMANALKAAYAPRKAFKNFLIMLRSGAAKLRQSDLAFLTPPKIRTKGRFQGIMPLGRWAIKILDIIEGGGRQKDGSIEQRISKMVPGLGLMRAFLEKFSASCHSISRILEILKTKGLNQATYLEVRAMASSFGPRSPIKLALDKWLERHLQIHCHLSIGQMPLVVSSDVIECLFGKFKVLLQRNSKAEFNRSILAIPCLCGTLTENEIKHALATTGHKELREWEKRNVTNSMVRRRHQFFGTPQRRKSANGYPA